MNKMELLNKINESGYEVSRVRENLYHGKCYVVATNYINGIFKTKRGAEGYIKRNSNKSYYDEYLQELVFPSAGECFEVLESELIEIANNKMFWYKQLRKEHYNITIGLGDNLIYEAKQSNVSDEIMNYIKDGINDIVNGNGLTVYEEPKEVIENIEIVKEVAEVATTQEITVDPIVEVVEAEQITNNSLNVEIKFNTEKNGIELYFTNKPNDDIRSQLKLNGYRWGKFNKCWYTKDSDKAREFLKSLGLLNSEEQQENNIINTAELKEVEQIEIDIDNINAETFPISKEVSRRENDGHWVLRSKERDHQQEILNYLNNYQNEFLHELNKLKDNTIINKSKTWLNSFKKRYYDNYYKLLRNNADNASWTTTGRDGRNARKDVRMNSRHDNLMRELIILQDEYKNKIGDIKRKIIKEKDQEFINAVLENKKEYQYKRIKKEVNVSHANNYFQGSNLQERNCYITTVQDQNYYILNVWGTFITVDTNGNMFNYGSCATLKDAKIILNYHLSEIEKINNIAV